MRSLSARLSLAFLLVAITAAALVAASMRLTGPERFNRLLREQERARLESLLTDYYTATGAFSGVGAALEAAGYLPEPGDRRQEFDPHPHATRRPGEALVFAPQATNRLAFALADEQGRVILSQLPNALPGGPAPADLMAQAEAIEVDGRTVGWILTPAEAFTLSPIEQAYLARSNQALWLAALGASGVALLIGLLLARSLARPLPRPDRRCPAHGRRCARTTGDGHRA